MMSFVIGLALAAAPTVSPEAEALGVRLARTGTLGVLLPLMVQKDTEELVASQKGMSTADQAQLRATATDVARRGIDRVMALEGYSYATLLSTRDLKALVAFAESPVAARHRAVQPKVIAATMEGLAGMDFKKDVLAAFCTRTGKACSK
ncbi:MAG: hypothetical protein ABR588_11300 [Sphingomicrobium sp.]|nr:hypothetical protein [Sphingomonadales bacterium]